MSDPRIVRFFTPEKCGRKPKAVPRGPARKVRLKAIIEKQLSVVVHWDKRIANWSRPIEDAETLRGKAMDNMKDARTELAEFDRAFLRDTSLAERRKREREKRKQKLDGHLCSETN